MEEMVVTSVEEMAVERVDGAMVMVLSEGVMVLSDGMVGLGVAEGKVKLGVG